MHSFFPHSSSSSHSKESRTTNSLGKFEVSVKKLEIKIRFTDWEKKNPFDATIKVDDFHHLKKTREFQEAIEDDITEILVHTWKTRRNQEYIIKYSETCQTALMFITNDDVQDRFNMIAHTVPDLDYFAEASFCRHASKTTFYLKQLSVFNEQQLKSILSHPKEFLSCISIGTECLSKLEDDLLDIILSHDILVDFLITRIITIEELKLVKRKHLEACLQSKENLKLALEFFTFHRILGLRVEILNINTDRKISDSISLRKKKSVSFILQNDEGSVFSCNISPQYIKIKHKATGYEFLTHCMNVNDHNAYIYNEECLSLPPIHLIHDWYLLSNKTKDDIIIKQFYCPDLQYSNKESHHTEFPCKEFRESREYLWLYKSAYHQELKFVAFLKKYGYDIAELRLTKGITADKLELLLNSDYENDLKDLMEAGMKLEDFGKVSYARMEFVFKYIDKAKTVLKLKFIDIDVCELFGILPLGTNSCSIMREESHHKKDNCRVM